MTTALGGSGYTVVPAELQNHANTIDQLATQLSHTLGSAQQATLGSQAFGEISVALGFANIIKAAATPGISTLSQAQTMLTTLNRTISTTAANYNSVEQSNTSRFQPSTGSTSTTTSTNPLMNPGTSPNSPAGNHGASILTDVSSLEKDISSGSWIQAGLAGMKVITDVGQIMSDPIGAVVSFGFNFLINAVKPLHDAIGWLVGSPGQVASYGGSWQGVAQSVVQIGNTFNSTLQKDTANWTGAAADSYKTYANDKVDTLSAVASATRSIGSATQVVGQLVAKVEGIIKDLVSKAMKQIIQTALGASFMITIPVVVAEVVSEVVTWIQKIASIIKMLTSAFSTLQPLLSNLSQLFGSAGKSLSSGMAPLTAIAPAAVPGINLPTPVARVAPVTTG